MNEQKIDYQKITDDFLKICGAKYAAFDLFNEDGKTFTTMAVSGDKGLIKKISNLMGIEFEGNQWEHDLSLAEKIKSTTITRFHSLKELVENVIPTPLIFFIEKTLNIGEVIYIKILKKHIMIGDFTLIMKKGERFDKDTLAEAIYKAIRDGYFAQTSRR